MTAPNAVFLKDYAPPSHRVHHLSLTFELGENETRLHTCFRVTPDAPAGRQAGPLCLHGRGLQLERILVDGSAPPATAMNHDEHGLTLTGLDGPGHTIEVTTVLRPRDNTALQGLYRSGGLFCTQCEPEGFRHMTYFPDRPDVMTRYTTTIIADSRRYPVLLANGNRTGAGTLEDGRHWVTWHDPHPKPSYLFAMVAGDLSVHQDTHVTPSGRRIGLQVYTEPRNAGRTGHAVEALQRAMRWDEEAYGLEYDLDCYMIVAVDDFNMGAMENKGLNIFNAACVLADPRTATDDDLETVEAVVAHEYFHNWTGNRVTLRDWFQLSLKEGLTVFREQQFCAETGSPALTRIRDARNLRALQFPEDSGPMAHPVRPGSYLDVSNFYTATVYDKGAEVIRMLHTRLGDAGFRAGVQLYLRRHDGRAATCEDFRGALEDATGTPLTDMATWYEQAGTPVLRVRGRHDPVRRCYHLLLSQFTPATPGQSRKQPLPIPVRLGLMDPGGQLLPLRMDGEAAPAGCERVITLHAEHQQITFMDIAEPPVPSLLRRFSAPVALDFPYTREQLALLLGSDDDPFVRWDAAQQLTLDAIIQALDHGGTPPLPTTLTQAVERVLAGYRDDPAFVAETLALPSEDYIAEQRACVEVEAIHGAREHLRHAMGSHFAAWWCDIHTDCAGSHAGVPRQRAAALRRLGHLALAYRVAAGAAGVEAALRQYHETDNMTDRLVALALLADADEELARQPLLTFYRRWGDDPLLVDKWLRIQATAQAGDGLHRVQRLMRHPAFDMGNPNRVRSVLGAFSQENPLHFHRVDGAGHAFVAERVMELDALNPLIAARLVLPLTRWDRFDADRAASMSRQLERIGNRPKLSKELHEIVAKGLAA
ncbi:aminopeptidase N [Aquisalimonas sp. 2447]|uniref:aminopeptidase N n=1 Tax=Aquisalimonas sp. 2447 TaxID=2740807 RepID=UPI0014324A93|nr:aminopeptidase N [Aquisalimonas sp. 2447]QIT55563.1 aminopeptidase N [Aquisalimonas sp. 2447]